MELRWIERNKAYKCRALKQAVTLMPDSELKSEVLKYTKNRNRTVSGYNEYRMLILTIVDTWYDDDLKNKIRRVLS